MDDNGQDEIRQMPHSPLVEPETNGEYFFSAKGVMLI